MAQNLLLIEKFNMSKWSEYKQKNGSTPLDLLNPRTKRVSDEIAKSRLEICNACPHLIQLTKQCKKCGCFMAVKTKIEASTCPIGKW
jgi:hypothetical protein